MAEALCQNTVKTEALGFVWVFYLYYLQAFACEGSESYFQRSFSSNLENNLTEKAQPTCREEQETKENLTHKI